MKFYNTNNTLRKQARKYYLVLARKKKTKCWDDRSCPLYTLKEAKAIKKNLTSQYGEGFDFKIIFIDEKIIRKVRFIK